jgi:hypothetical protein
MSEDKKVVEFHRPSALEDENAAERDSRLRTLVAQRARQPAFERVLYLEDDAKKHNILSAKLKELIDAVVKENEKKARETKVEHEKREHRVEKKQITARREQRRERERQEREERREQERQEREQEREEREARKEIERKDREKQKAFAAIVKLPSAEHDGRLAALARQLGEDINILHEEFAELRIEEEERIKRGQVEPWDEPVNTRVLLNAVAAQFEKYIIIHDLTIAPIIPLWRSLGSTTSRHSLRSWSSRAPTPARARRRPAKRSRC